LTTCRHCHYGPQGGLNYPATANGRPYLSVRCEECRLELFALPAYGPKPKRWSPYMGTTVPSRVPVGDSGYALNEDNW
jgi:hypothetical protein